MNMKKLMKEAQKMQEQLARELDELQVTASAGGGVVTATLNGNKQLLSIEIDPRAVDPDDVEMLQDLVVAAVNEAARRVEESMQDKLGGLAGMGGLGGGLGGMFGGA
jgi:DNA-binding YbaB/EbfC family protein